MLIAQQTTAGELEVRPRRKDRVSGVTIRPVVLPAKQMDLI